MALLEFQDVAFRCGEKEILHSITLAVEAGEYLTVIGPSGSGKSTFLKLGCHLLTPARGRILFEDADMLTRDPVELRKKIAYCFQTPVLFGKTVEDNLLFPCRVRKKELDKARAVALLERFQLSEDFLAHEVHNLSGGEKQRVALVRTLLFPPQVLLLDEATAALDAENAAMVEEAVEQLHREGMTILWVTHNEQQSLRNANRRLTIDNGSLVSVEVLR